MLACFYSREGNSDDVSQCALTTSLNSCGYVRDNSDSRWALPSIVCNKCQEPRPLSGSPHRTPTSCRQRLGGRFAHSGSKRWLTHSDDDDNDDDDVDDGGDDDDEDDHDDNDDNDDNDEKEEDKEGDEGDNKND